MGGIFENRQISPGFGPKNLRRIRLLAHFWCQQGPLLTAKHQRNLSPAVVFLWTLYVSVTTSSNGGYATHGERCDQSLTRPNASLPKSSELLEPPQSPSRLFNLKTYKRWQRWALRRFKDSYPWLVRTVVASNFCKKVVALLANAVASLIALSTVVAGEKSLAIFVFELH